MPTIYLPESSRSGIEQDRVEVLQQFSSIKSVIDAFEPDLRRIDPHLRIVKAHDNLPANSQLKAGYWHILRLAPGHPTTILPLEYDNGEYREPGSWIFPFMEEQDMWNDRAMRASRNRAERLRAAEARHRDFEARQRADQFNERLASANRTSILVTKNIHA